MNAERSQIPKYISLKGRDCEISFDRIHQLFSESHYGRKLAAMPRYGRYKPNFISTADWIKILGPDVSNLEHMWVTHQLSRRFLERERRFRSKSEKEDLLLASVVHDWGEAIEGDLVFGTKTSDDEEREKQALNTIAAEILPTKYQDRGLGVWINDVAERVVFNPKTPIGRTFNAIERWGYMQTTLRAFSYADRLDDRSGLGHHLHWLTYEVSINQVPPLIEYATVYYPIRLFLDQKKKQLDKFFFQTESANYSHLSGSEQYSTRSFERVKQLWLSL